MIKVPLDELLHRMYNQELTTEITLEQGEKENEAGFAQRCRKTPTTVANEFQLSLMQKSFEIARRLER